MYICPQIQHMYVITIFIRECLILTYFLLTDGISHFIYYPILTVPVVIAAISVPSSDIRQ